MSSLQYGRHRAFPRSPSPTAFSPVQNGPFSPSSSVSTFAFALSSFLSLHPRRRILLISTFIAGIILTAIMKRESFLWLLTATAGATPLVGYNQGSNFDYPGLRFNFDRQFRITIFNDLHLGDKARPNTDEKTIGVMNSVLDSESGTDLVVLNGDLTSCEWIGPEEVNGLLDQILDPLIARKMPFAATFGNHDMSTTCNTRRMSEHIWDKGNAGTKQLTWTTSSVDGGYNDVGTSNYYVPIYSMGGGGNPELKMILWFFDSKGGRQYQPGGNDVPVSDWVDQKVVSWFTLTRDQIQADHGGKAVPSLAFVHIPPSVTYAFQKSGQRTATTEPGLNEELIGAQADGDAGADFPFMQALVETQGLMAVFSGHDHAIDWCMKWSATKAIPAITPATGNNMHLCFGRHAGYGGYSDWMRGGRHVVIEEDQLGQNVLETWIRLEDGSISGHVMLNSTYSSDQYPPVEKKKSPTFAPGVSAQNVSIGETTSSTSTKTTSSSKHVRTTSRRTAKTTSISKPMIASKQTVLSTSTKMSKATTKPKPTFTVLSKSISKTSLKTTSKV